MTTPGQLPAASSHDADEAHEAFDPEPARSLPPDEKPSPLWLPALGAGLLLVVALAWVVTGDQETTAATEGAAPTAATAAPAASAAPTARPRPARTARAVARPPAKGDSTARPRLRRIPPPSAARPKPPSK
jgi:hypothetical protein